MRGAGVWTLVVAGMVAMDLLMFRLLRVYGSEISREHCLMENLQALFLVISTIVFLLRAKRAEREFSTILVCGALLSFTMFVREYDVRKLDVPQLVLMVGSGSIKNALFILLWSVAVCYITVHFRAYIHFVRDSLTVKHLLPFAASAVFLVLGELFEKKVLPGTPHVFYEELCELNGYLIFLAASILTRPLAARSVSSPVPDRILGYSRRSSDV